MDAGVDISVEDGDILISGADGLDISVAGLDGIRLYSGKVSGNFRLNVEKGIYIVRIDGLSAKTRVN